MKRFTSRRVALAAGLLAVALSATGCGSSDDTSSGADTSQSPSAGSSGSSGSSDAAALDQLNIHHPSTLAFAAPFTIMAKDHPKLTSVETVTYATWDSPDVLRSLLTSGKTDLAATPSYVGANLYNKGVDVRLAGVTVWGLLHLIGPAGAPTSWDSLKGKAIALPYKGDMPDLVLRFLLTKNGLDPDKDVTLNYFAQGSEVVGQVVSGKTEYALLPEHAATVAVVKATKEGQKVAPLMDMQAEWAKATGASSPRLPQAGVLVRGELVDKNPKAIGEALTALDESIKAVNAKDAATLTAVSQGTKVPEPIVGKVVDRLNLDFVPAAEARSELEKFYTELSTLNPDIIGGKLPDEKFYLDDLR